MSGYYFMEVSDKEKERDLLLKSLILHMIIGKQPIRANAFQKFFLKITGINYKFSCFLKLSDLKDDEGVFLDYGLFNDEKEFHSENYIHLDSRGGLRFCRMSF